MNVPGCGLGLAVRQSGPWLASLRGRQGAVAFAFSPCGPRVEAHLSKWRESIPGRPALEPGLQVASGR